MANKGGVGVSLVAKGTSLCFIGAHLNAHDERVERRNEDYIDERSGLANPSKGLAKPA